MNKNELIDAVASSSNLDRSDAANAVEAVLSTVTTSVAAGEEVNIAGFGKFTVAERAERQGRNPQTGEALTIAASKSPKFSAAKAFKDALK